MATRPKPKKKKKREGYVYVLTNQALKSNHVKIGKTTRPPEVRASEISRSTGVPLPFEVFHREWVSDCHAAESAIHKHLDDQRLNNKREFFVMTPQEATKVVTRMCKPWQRSMTSRFKALSHRSTRHEKITAVLLELGLGVLQIFGTGHIYRGQPKRGFAFMALYWVLLGGNIALSIYTKEGIVWLIPCWIIVAVVSVIGLVRGS